MFNVDSLNRRQFIQVVAASSSALTLGIKSSVADENQLSSNLEFNVWLRFTANNQVIIQVGKSEMGQGVTTALPMIVAEELEFPWQAVQFEFAPSINGYGTRNTGGSNSVTSSFRILQQIGAAARYMFSQAAAQRFKVNVDMVQLKEGVFSNSINTRTANYSDLIVDAARISPPLNPKLKSTENFTLIGKSAPRLDIAEKINGEAKFGIDVELPDMVYAAIHRHPVIGTNISNRAALDEQARQLNVKLIDIPEGIAAVANSYWTVQQALLNLPIQYSEQPQQKARNQADVESTLDTGLQAEGNPFLSGTPTEEIADRFEAQYAVPYLAHAPMEPLNCTAHIKDDGCEVWLGTQDVSTAKLAAAETLNIDPDKVKVNLMYLGGGFGARLNHESVVQAVTIAKAINKPVKVIWSREQDMQTNYYRPAVKSKFAAGFNKQGELASINIKLCSSSIMEQLGASHRFYQRYKDTGTDILTIHGLTSVPYSLPATTICTINTPLELRVAQWRSVGTSQNIFFLECFIVELANHQQQDPLLFRRTLASNNPRAVRLLDHLREHSNWRKTSEGHAQGLAIGGVFGSLVGQVVEVSINEGKIKVHKVTCAIDCGLVANPNILRQQIESGIIFGLTAALYGEITIEDGKVKQSNFHDYPLLSLRETPEIKTVIVDSDAPMGGIGEVAVPTIAPAVTNAVFHLTGKRIRTLPLKNQRFVDLAYSSEFSSGGEIARQTLPGTTRMS